MKARALVAWNLRRPRVERGVSQEVLAYDAGVDRAYVGGLERQTQNPTIDLLERLSKALGANIAELFLQPPKGSTRPKPLNAGRKAKTSAKKRA